MFCSDRKPFTASNSFSRIQGNRTVLSHSTNTPEVLRPAALDRDSKYEQYHFNYLPDNHFTNMALEFDLEVTNLQPIDDPRIEWIPWRSLSYIMSDGTGRTIPLWDHATKQGGTFGVASRTFTLNGTPAAFDRMTLWYGNLAFDKIVSVPPETAPQTPIGTLRARSSRQST